MRSSEFWGVIATGWVGGGAWAMEGVGLGAGVWEVINNPCWLVLGCATGRSGAASWELRMHSSELGPRAVGCRGGGAHRDMRLVVRVGLRDELLLGGCALTNDIRWVSWEQMRSRESGIRIWRNTGCGRSTVNGRLEVV